MRSLTDKEQADIIRFSIYLMQGIMLISTNGIIVLTVMRHKALRHLKEYILIGGLALADGLSGMGASLAGPIRINVVLQNRSQETMSRRQCSGRPYIPFWTLSFPLQGIMLTVISIDRFIAVYYPLRYLQLGYRYALRIIIVVYLFGVLLTIFGLVSVYPESEVDPNITAMCIHGWSLLPWFYQGIYTIQVSGILASIAIYLIVMFVYRGKMQKMIANATTTAAVTNQLRKQKRLTKSLGISCIFTFFLFGTPNMVMWFTYFIDYDFYNLSIIAYIMNNFNPMMNLFIYLKRHQEFKMGARALFQCKDLPPDVALWNKGANNGGAVSNNNVTGVGGTANTRAPNAIAPAEG